RKVAAAKLAEIDQKEGPLPPEPVALVAPQGAPAAQAAPVAQTATAGHGAPLAQNNPSPMPGAPGAQSGPSVARAPVAAPVASAPTVAAAASAAVPAPVATTQTAAVPAAVATTQTPAVPAPTAASQTTAAPAPVAAVQAPAKQTNTQTAATVAQPAPPAVVQKAAYHPPAPIATIPIEGSRPASNGAYRAGEPFFVGVISPHDGYLYCYLVDDRQVVSQFYPTPAQTPARLSGGTLTVVNSASPLVANHRGHRQQVACFSSPKDLGRQPLEPESVRGLEALKTRFAIAVSGAYAMGVFDVNVQ
ncbi:MAG: hypothetical protein JO133_15745, partial [Burkholderiaceae bacterium]|nr:hypothetical protein [Burkholderiaceae bacterium]